MDKGRIADDSRQAILAQLGAITIHSGIRHADKKFSSIRQLALSEALFARARELLQAEPVIVRVILFDKTERANWWVSWHQVKPLPWHNGRK